jgi:hypothetical protein
MRQRSRNDRKSTERKKKCKRQFGGSWPSLFYFFALSLSSTTAIRRSLFFFLSVSRTRIIIERKNVEFAWPVLEEVKKVICIRKGIQSWHIVLVLRINHAKHYAFHQWQFILQHYFFLINKLNVFFFRIDDFFFLHNPSSDFSFSVATLFLI